MKNYGGSGTYGSGPAQFSYPATLAADSFALDGAWDVSFDGITPGAASAGGGDSRIRLRYHASEVRLVLAGSGTVTFTIDGASETFPVEGIPNSYPLAKTAAIEAGTVDVTVSPGVKVYSFTFG